MLHAQRGARPLRESYSSIAPQRRQAREFKIQEESAKQTREGMPPINSTGEQNKTKQNTRYTKCHEERSKSNQTSDAGGREEGKKERLHKQRTPETKNRRNTWYTSDERLDPSARQKKTKKTNQNQNKIQSRLYSIYRSIYRERTTTMSVPSVRDVYRNSHAQLM